jgi:hypothetical protein
MLTKKIPIFLSQGGGGPHFYFISHFQLAHFLRFFFFLKKKTKIKRKINNKKRFLFLRFYPIIVTYSLILTHPEVLNGVGRTTSSVSLVCPRGTFITPPPHILGFTVIVNRDKQKKHTNSFYLFLSICLR